MNEFFFKLLDSREKRFELQKHLIEKYKKPIISFMLNIPGPVKRTDSYVDFHKMGIAIIKSLLNEKIIYEQYYDEETGMFYIAVLNMDAEDLKKEMIEIENSDMGRLFDIDVFDENFNQITRSSLFLEQRKCLLCNNRAKICIRERNHSYEDLIKETNNIIDFYIKQNSEI